MSSDGGGDDNARKPPSPDEMDMDTSHPDLGDFEDSREMESGEPFQDFSSISEQHSEVNTTLPLYYKRQSSKSSTDNTGPLASSELKDNSTSNGFDATLDDDIPSDAENVDNVPSPLRTPNDEFRSMSFSDSASPLLIRSIDQRFQTRLSSLTSIRSSSSSFSNSGANSPNNSFRLNSAGKAARHIQTFEDDLFLDDTTKSPWETVRWSKLRKISSQIFSESAQRAYGKPTCIIAAAHIVLGMSHGHILVFDYHQTLQAIIGGKTKAIECGQVTALAVSADFSYVASAYSSGHIFTWDLAKPATPNIHITPIAKSQLLKAKHPDGHIENTPVIYLNFTGKRHSALVSGDSSGMAFSHDTTRTVVGRSVITKRILGRYPTTTILPNGTAAAKKPTTLLACSPLPLGNVVQPTDRICLVAIMTPYLLAIVSVLPTPQTEFKTGRPKTVSNDIGLSGCVAWLPALKPTSGASETNTRLAYSWSNVVTIMEIVATDGKKEKGSSRREVSLSFQFQKRYIGNEAIVSIQWISRQVLGLVTSTQRLILLNEDTMTVSATVDLLNKHIMHTDFFSSILKDLTFVDSDTNEVRPVVVCDGYFNSVRGFKGKVFLLGNYELVAGTVSNWADRLLDTMEMGDYIGAIDLATNYYLGTQDLAIVGLPSDDTERHAVVLKNLPGMIIASIKYTFNGSQTPPASEMTWEEFLSELCEVCLEAWVAIGKPNELLEEIFDEFEHNNYALLFFDSLTRLISNGQVSQLPPAVFRELVKTHVSAPELADRLEEVICSLDIQTLDLDAAITLARQHHLKDTLIYIWNHALDDYITPLVEFIQTITHQQKNDSLTDAEKVYPYISYILSGRVYPTGLAFEDPQVASRARSYIYYLLFSSTNIAWPQGGPVILTKKGSNPSDEPAYPYLTALLKFNTPAFFTALNEAFEDTFLNDSEEYARPLSGNQLYPDTADEAMSFGSTVNRQLIVNILLEVFSYTPELNVHKIFLNIFIARNYPKYSQFIILPGNILTKVLEEVCNCTDPELKDECELSVESLLSKYKPYDLDNIISLLQEVKFYGVLQYIFRSERKYFRLLETALQLWKENETSDSGQSSSKLLDTVAEGYKNTKDQTSPLQAKDRNAIDNLITENFVLLVELNPGRMVKILANNSPALHENVFTKLSGDANHELQYQYLDALFTLVATRGGQYPLPAIKYRHLYVKVLAERKMNRKLFKLFKNLITGPHDVELDAVRADLEKSGAADCLVLILRRQNKGTEALKSVIVRLKELDKNGEEVQNAVAADGDADAQKVVEENELSKIHVEMSKYLELGIDICSQREATLTKSTEESKSVVTAKSAGNFKLQTLSEKLWVTLIDAIVEISKTDQKNDADQPHTLLTASPHGRFTRNLLQSVLSSLLDKSGTKFDNATIVRICSALLTPISSLGAASPQSRTIGAVRPILTELFSAYRYQQNVLIVAKQLLDQDAYKSLCDLIAARSKGWKIAPSGECEGCGKPIIGLGIDADWLYGRWEERSKAELTKLARKSVESALTPKQQRTLLKGKSKRPASAGTDGAPADHSSSPGRRLSGPSSAGNGASFTDVNSLLASGQQQAMSADWKAIAAGQQPNEDKDILVVFKCSHAYHLGCLRNLGVKGTLKCIIDDA